MDHLLEVNEVTKSYKDFMALDHLSLEIPKGSIFGLLGPNGAGKTTLIRIINQIIAPDTGTIHLNGKPMKPSMVQDIGYLPEERGLYPKMKVGEQLIYLARLKNLSKSDAYEKVGKWLREFNIMDWWDQPVETLSKGMAQKLQFIATVVHEPYFMILDEPFSGFDPVNADLVKEKILELSRQGTTIMLSTHQMENVEALCQNLAMINKARKVLDGNIEEIKQQYRTNTYEVYLEGHYSESDLRLPINYKIQETIYHDSQNSTKVLLQTHEPEKNNQVLSNLMEHHTIESFREILPSIHDIFVSKVKTEVHA